MHLKRWKKVQSLEKVITQSLQFCRVKRDTKSLVAILGVNAINALTADKYNDEIPPVITINGQNPLTMLSLVFPIRCRCNSYGRLWCPTAVIASKM